MSRDGKHLLTWVNTAISEVRLWEVNYPNESLATF
jgi:hypothetical protein